MNIPKRRLAVSVEFALFKTLHHTPCAACRYVREGEPLVRRIAHYATGRIKVDFLCPYCVHEWEAASIIVKAYPRVYEMYRDGMYHRVKLVPVLELFTDTSSAHED